MFGIEVLDQPWRVSWRVHLFFLIFFCGVIAYHPSIQRRVIGYCECVFEQESQARLVSEGAVFHALLGKVVFNDVVVQKKGSAQPLLTAKQTNISFAPVQSLLCNRFIFESSIAGMRIPMDRGLGGVLDVVNFFKELLATSSEYISLRGLKLSEFSLGDVSVSAVVSVPDKVPAELWDIAVSEGDLTFPVTKNSSLPVRIGKLSFKIPSTDGDRIVVGELFGKGETSHFVMREGEHIKALFEHTDTELKYRLIAPTDDLVACAQALLPEKKIKERYAAYRAFMQTQDLLIKCSGSFNIAEQKGRVVVASSHCRSQASTGFSGSVVHDASKIVWRGAFSLNNKNELQSHVVVDIEKKQLECGLYNSKPIVLPRGGYVIFPGKMKCSLKNKSFDALIGRYEITAASGLYSAKKSLCAKGLFSYHDDLFSLAGTVNKHTLHAVMRTTQGLRVQRMLVVDDRKNIDINLKSRGPMHEWCDGTISQNFLYRCIPGSLGMWVSGEVGKIAFAIDQREAPTRMVGDVNLFDSACCVAGSSNPLLSGHLRFDIDMRLKAATLSDIELTLASGSILSKEILVNWSSDGVSFFHFPLTVSNVFVNKDRDFGAIVDGSGSVDWIDGGKYRVDGNFVIKKSQISSVESLSGFSSSDGEAVIPVIEKQKNEIDVGIDGTIVVKTLEPTVLNLPTLRSKMHVDVDVGGYFRSDGRILPKVSGVLRLDGGVVEVLGRPLRIMKGAVDLLASQTDNPLIDFFAYTNVKQYRITLHGSGTLQQPTINFESNPPLSQEQIIGLLLSGSEHADINQQLPGIFLQNIHKMLNSGDASALSRSVWRPLLNSLRYVQLLPYQDNLSSQKTVKARLNIDLGPHMRALLHKDIFGKEAVAMLVEYDVNDDLNVRLMRQSSGTIGAEAEIRLKF